MDYIIGLDGGGTNTRAVAFDMAGNVLFEQIEGFANVLIDAEIAIANIVRAIDACQKALPAQLCQYIFIGIAGINSGMYRTELETEIKKFATPFTITNDAVIAHAAALTGEDGILAISGTGSIMYGKKDAEFKTVGGWGHLLGDEGSGYDIVIAYFKYMIAQFEAGFEQSDLTTEILTSIGKQQVEEIKAFIYTSSKGEIAELTKIIVVAANHGNQQATLILEMAAEALAKQTLLLAQNMQFENVVKIGLKGSILTKVAAINETYKRKVTAVLPNVQFIEGDASSPKGAYYLALKALEKL